MKKLGFIGGGNMAEALSHGLLAHKLFKASDIIVSDVAPDAGASSRERSKLRPPTKC